MNKTNIEYLDYTWNPIAMRCSPVSEGCKNCWHLRMCNQMTANLSISKRKRLAYAGGEPILDEEELFAPSKLKKPARIGVQFMGDLFHENVPDEMIYQIFECIAWSTQHIFIILTKRPDRAKKYMSGKTYFTGDSLPNLWLGVSVENQQTADERIPILLQIPAAKRWVSVEPMLEFVDLERIYYEKSKTVQAYLRTLSKKAVVPFAVIDYPGIDWAIVGCESGPQARPMKWDWAIDLRRQCKNAGVPFFFKQPFDKTTPEELKVREIPG